jgi:hypothetical protein
MKEHETNTEFPDQIRRLKDLLAEWVYWETSGPFFHEDEHGPDSLLHRTRKELE